MCASGFPSAKAAGIHVFAEVAASWLRYGFYTARGDLLQQIYGRQIYRSCMNNMILRARQMSLALLVIAVVDHGHLQADYSGATPGSSGLMRLGRDLMRRASGEISTRIPSSARVTGPA